jgi:hypothetical protein
MKDLNLIQIKGDNLSGVLPTELGLLEGLQLGWSTGNNFAGEMPAELCGLRGQEEGLTTLEADCSAFADPGLVAIACPTECCTLCCDPTGEVCFPVTSD